MVERVILSGARRLIAAHGVDAEAKVMDRIYVLSRDGDQQGVALWRSVLRAMADLRESAER